MQTTTGAILLVIGVVALFAAIVGGGVKIREIEVGSLPSRWRQLFLAIFGVLVGLIGLVMVTDDGSGGAETATQNTESADQGGEATTSEPTADPNAADGNAEESTSTESTDTEPPADGNSGGDSGQ